MTAGQFLCSLGGRCDHPICGMAQTAIKRSRRNSANARSGWEKRKAEKS